MKTKKIVWTVLSAAAFLGLLSVVPIVPLTGRDAASGIHMRGSVNFLGFKQGVYTESLPSGARILQGQFFFGRLAGTWKWFDEDGKVSAECHYEDKPASCRAFYDTGETKEVAFSYPERPRHLNDLFFDLNHSQLESSYRAGILQGEYKQYFKSGAVKIEGHYDRGDPRGIWKFFRSNSKLRMKVDYQGELDMLVIQTRTFYENGSLASQSTEGSSLAAKNREDNLFYESGRPFLKMKFRAGLPEEIAFYDPLGASLAVCDTDEFGLFCALNGEAASGSTKKVQAYYAGGVTALDIEASGGRLNGRLTRFYENGKIMSYLSFAHGALDGEAAAFDESGKLEQIKQFKNWKLINDSFYDGEGEAISYPQPKS